MAKQYETGHAINLSNFMVLVSLITEYGETYNPVNENLTVANMTLKWTAVNDMQNAYLLAKDNTNLPIDERELKFEKLNKLARRTVSLYESTHAIKQAVADAKSFLKKITGSNVKVKKLEDGITPDPKYISNSHQSFVQKMANFAELINIYKNDTNYASNEDDLKITSLETVLSDLKTANDTVVSADVHATKLRNIRNHGLYDIDTGLVDIAQACKKYVKGLFGAGSPEAKAVAKIKFRRYRL